ncbi:hypothetical protein [uncultured Roseobacter sp.]|uniref:hypothetical protein n=1 Tax=uncultured Roseobacter sp. TaxID=114847 RepID=UPI0026031B5D|nr:hypothetical protein [uncultured Roseobacter sp.]
MEALRVALLHGISATKGGNANFLALKKKNHSIANDLMITFAVINSCASRISDEDLKGIVLQSATTDENSDLSSIRLSLETAVNALVAYNLDDHFLDEADVDAFDYAELNDDEKDEIRTLMSSARFCVNGAKSLLEWQKRNILHHISKIENELLKTKSRFEAFLAAGYEAGELVKRIGEDAQPIASAIQKALTITYRKVEGQQQIEEEAEPKKLPKPRDDMKTN